LPSAPCSEPASTRLASADMTLFSSATFTAGQGSVPWRRHHTEAWRVRARARVRCLLD
jgi:hypothetical protein